VRGASVDNGYLNQGGLTAAAFVPPPTAIGERLYRTGDRVRRLDGVWHFVGRLEGFLNVNGYRVEPGEVEAALRAIEGVVDGAVGMSPASGSLQAWVIAAPETSWEPSALDAALRRQLPTHMVPTRWHRVDALPLAANGKLDRSQLCELDEGVSDAQPNAERISPNESRLMSIWCALLNLDAIGLDDNFFALGGDSILGLQMVARARDAGLAMTPKQLFDFPTVRALAKEVAVPQATTASAIQRDRAIDVPLTPIQQWFFALTLAQPAHWNQSLLLTVPESLEPSRLRRSVEKLIEVHDALRLGFDHDGTAWRQDYRAWDTLDLAGCFSVVDIATCDDQGAVAEIERVCERQQASLNLNCPPLFKVVYFDGGPARSGRLFLLAHHLVVDGVSWRIVLDDLRLLYEGREVLAPRASYLDWANAIRTVDTGSSPTPEPPIGPREETFELPCDRVGDNLQSSTQVHTLRLAPALTQVLVSFGGAEPSLSVDDLCISAIAAALHRWTAHRWSSMECEHHGRDGSESQSLDLSRTVGWFTARYLVAIDVAYGERDGEFVRRVARERDRALTDATTRFAARTAARKTGSRAPVPVTFNYLGQVDMGLPSLQWGSAPESGGAQRGPANERPQRLAINALIRDGALQITIIFSEQCHHAETIQAFGDALLAFLDRFVRAIDDESRALEGSSIEADVSLDDRDLGNLLDELRGAD
ncbi:MAG: condensation domain-containing protein, partial [Pseudomonadota bacterium]